MTVPGKRSATSWSFTASFRARGGRITARSWGPKIGTLTKMSIQGSTILRYDNFKFLQFSEIFILSRSISCTRGTRSSGLITQNFVRVVTQRWMTPSSRTTCAHAGTSIIQHLPPSLLFPLPYDIPFCRAKSKSWSGGTVSRTGRLSRMKKL